MGQGVQIKAIPSKSESIHLVITMAETAKGTHGERTTSQGKHEMHAESQVHWLTGFRELR